jgi:hypothetical protein
MPPNASFETGATESPPPEIGGVTGAAFGLGMAIGNRMFGGGKK